MQPIEQDAAELWNAYRASRDVQLRNQLAERHLPLVRWSAARISRRLPPRFTFDELFLAGCLGLLRAVQAFDPAWKIAFSTYACPCIKGAIGDYLRTAVGVPRTLRRFERDRQRAADRLASSLDRPPTDAELAAEMDMPHERFARLRRQARPWHAVRLSSIDYADDVLVDRRGSVDAYDSEDIGVAGQALRAARQVLADVDALGLTRQQSYVLARHYRDGRNLADIGRELCLTRERVRQIHDKTLERLRFRLRGLCRNRPPRAPAFMPVPSSHSDDRRQSGRDHARSLRAPSRPASPAPIAAAPIAASLTLVPSPIEARSTPPRSPLAALANAPQPARRPVRPAPVRPSKDTRVPTSSKNFGPRKLVPEIKNVTSDFRAPPRF